LVILQNITNNLLIETYAHERNRNDVDKEFKLYSGVSIRGDIRCRTKQETSAFVDTYLSEEFETIDKDGDQVLLLEEWLYKYGNLWRAHQLFRESVRVILKDRTGKHSGYSERVNLHGLVFL
jgi:hypothetical protein